MPRFLSQEWVDAMTAALSAEDVRSSLRDVALTLQQRVSGTPQGEVSVWTSFTNGTIAGGVGDGPEADVTFEMAYETASALARGDLNHQAAFMEGKLKVTGNVGKLLLNQDALQALGPAMAEIDTQF